jgi:tetratricopeptide (TPR) repeat protein
MKLDKSLIVVLVVLNVSCSISKRTITEKSEMDSSMAEIQYYRLFTDATKHALLGNYKTAIGLYNTCVVEFPERAAPYYQLSSLFLRAQKVPESREFARKALNRDSSNIWYLLQLANIYQYESIYDSAVLFYEKAIELNESEELKYNLALLYSRSDNGEKAIALLNELERGNEGSKELMMTRHNVYHSMKDFDAAVGELELIAKYFPDDPASYGLLAEYLSEIGRKDYARDVYDGLVKAEPGNGIVLLSFAEFYAQNELLDSAFMYYSRAFCCSDLLFEQKIGTSINFISQPDFLNVNKSWIIDLLDTIPRFEADFRLYAAYADIYINLEEYGNAKNYLDSTLMYEKSNYMLWEQTLLVNNFIGIHEDVISVANNCLKEFPDKPNVFFLRAVSENELGKKEEAVNSVDSMLNLDPSQQLRVQGLNLLAEIYRSLNRNEESDSCYEVILKEEPENLMIRNNYAYYLSIREVELDRARELSELTIIREPDNATYLDTYGWIMFKLGQLSSAKKYIEQSIRKGAYNNAEVLDHYGDIMFELGNCADAIEAWQKAEQTDSTFALKDKILKAREICK